MKCLVTPDLIEGLIEICYLRGGYNPLFMPLGLVSVWYRPFGRMVVHSYPSFHREGSCQCHKGSKNTITPPS